MTKVAVQLSGVISMAKDFGVSLTGVVKSDSLQCNRNSSQRWLGRSVPRCQGAVFVDPVNDQGLVISRYKKKWDEQCGSRHDQG